MKKPIKLKYKVRQNNKGEWVVWVNKTQYFANAVYATKADAVYASLLREGGEIVDKLDNVQARLEATGRVSAVDPYGWRA